MVFKLERRHDIQREKDPWAAHNWGITHSVVVTAKDEDDARAEAAKNHGFEGAEAWLNPEFTTCTPVRGTKANTILVHDYEG